MLKHRRPPRAQFEQARSSPQYGTSALHTELKLSSTTAQKKASIANHHLAQAQSWILQLSIIVRIVSIFLLVLVSQLQQAFDTSHNLLSYSLDPNLLHSLSSGGFQFLLSFVRWDTIYFVSSAAPTSQLHKGGYVWEQALAFQPGIIALLRLAGFVTPSMDGEWSPTSSMLLTTLLSNLATMLSPILLFRLGWTITRNKELSFTAAILSIFAPSAGTTLASPTPESFFSFASLMGLVTLESKTASTKGRLSWGKIVGASLWFAIATTFRTNGTLLLGYIGFKLISSARSTSQGLGWLLKLVVSTTICLAPSAMFQMWAFTRFCVAQDTMRPWCRKGTRSVYGFVQSHYWNVGFMRYWQIAQLPNFVVASPILIMIFLTAWRFYRRSSWMNVLRSLIAGACNEETSQEMEAKQDQGLMMLATNPEMVPFIVHGLVLGMVLLFGSHVQISVRFATAGGIPMFWWGVAHMVLYGKRWMRRWIVTYFSMQFCVGMVLYAGFYPPA